MHVVAVSTNLIVKRNSGRAKVAQEKRCRMCLHERDVRWPAYISDPETPEWIRKQLKPAHARQLTRHHLVPQSWFSVQPPEVYTLCHVDANIVPLCRRCHDQVEHDEMARAMLRKVLGQDEIAFCVQLMGLEWFDRRYPRLGRAREYALA
jgi:hypothetical protein